MHPPFFPGPIFGWTYWTALTGLLAVAAYLDGRTMIVPKKLTLTLLPLGLLFNLARGAGLGLRGADVWCLGAQGPWAGAADGLLFGLAGFLLGFGIFFLLWTFGTCGGGDVKLFAALGAWVGPELAVMVLCGTLVVVLAVTVARLAGGAATRALQLSFALALSRPLPVGAPARGKRRLVTYSLPVAVVTAVVVLWTARADLRLATPQAGGTAGGGIHAR